MIIALNNEFVSNKQFKIINFFSDWCPPCHAFMPNFYKAEETFWEYFDFININTWKNILLSQKFNIRWTPTIIIINENEIIFRQSWVPNWSELKEKMIELIWIDPKKEKTIKRKKIFGIF